VLTIAAVALVALLAAPASPAETSGGGVDRVVARFYAPETGGTARPRFVGERTLALEARIEAMAESPEGIGDDYGERHVREALDHHIAEAILASLARKLIHDSPPGKRPSNAELGLMEQQMSVAFLERLGGRARVEAAVAAEQLTGLDLDGILRRQALAAWYLDRAVTPLLQPTDEQLREVFRTSAHPYRGQPFDNVRVSLQRWFVVERVRVAESAFLQGARARVRTVIVPK
jgi:hypothetical protein